MEPLDLNDVVRYVENNIDDFHSRRLSRLKSLKLNTVLKKKNPYLFKAKNIMEANELVKCLMDAYLSSQEETIFGGFLEELAIFISQKVYGGQKSSSEGIDLDFKKDETRYLVSIKSGPNWGNSNQIARMKSNFIKARKILNTNTSGQHVVFVNGCCYGKDRNPDKGEYLKYCGQDFWELISGNKELYKEIIEPLGYEAKLHNESFQKEFYRILNMFTLNFIEDFCDDSGEINWAKLVEFNSASSS